MIAEELIKRFGAQEVSLQKDDVLFYEDEEALNYYQIKTGSIKMVNYSYDGQEFIQGFFGPNESFGEPPLFGGFKYPSDAIATIDTVVFKLRKESFLNLLKENFDIHLKFSHIFSQRLRYKSIMMREISSYAPEHRILTLIKYLREKSKIPKHEKYTVPFTRQQMADMTGLRVETVIRAVSKLKDEGKIQVVKHKILSD